MKMISKLKDDLADAKSAREQMGEKYTRERKARKIIERKYYNSFQPREY